MELAKFSHFLDLIVTWTAQGCDRCVSSGCKNITLESLSGRRKRDMTVVYDESRQRKLNWAAFVIFNPTLAELQQKLTAIHMSKLSILGCLMT